MITELSELLRRKRRGDEQEDWELEDVHYKLLCSICWMGISSLEIAVYGYKVNAKYLENAAWHEIERRLKLMDAIVEGTKNTTLIQTAPRVWDFIQEEEEEEE